MRIDRISALFWDFIGNIEIKFELKDKNIINLKNVATSGC